ncbi:MAG: adenylate/guanylate cyclase domain-containing protein [Bdellovibrionota bacterium]
MADKCLLWVGAALPWTFVGLYIVRRGREREYFASFTNAAFSQKIVEPFYLITCATFTLLFLWALFVRKRPGEHRLLVHAICQACAVHSALVVYFTGTLTSSLWIAVVGGLMVGLVVFGLGPMIAASVTVCSITFVTGLGSALGYLPYAPWLSSLPFSDGVLRIPTAGAVLLLHVILGLLVMLAAMSVYVISEWRKREGQVVEFSELLKKMFGRYLSPEVMNSLIQNPEALELGGQRRRVTILMTDLRGFTAMAERMEPERFVHMLNAYYEVMVETIEKFQGTVNEIIGDALLVIFGAPQEMPDRAKRAVACAIAMQNAMGKINEKNRSEGLPELEMGIGLNEAEVIVGNIGSTRRSKFTVIGSGVNLASRIESYSVGGQVLVSQSVADACGGILRIDGRQDVLPKGSQNPLTIYEVGGIGGDYQSVLERQADELQKPHRLLRFRLTPLDGKHVGESVGESEVLGLSGRGARLRESVSAMEAGANVKLNLLGVPPQLARLDFYAKILSKPEGDGSMPIRFTAVPSEVAAYFEGLMERGS